MARVWSEENKFASWLKVEVAAVQAWADMGVVPRDAADKIARNAAFKVDRHRPLRARDAPRHELVPALGRDSLGEESRWVHLGLTSYDTEDPATAAAHGRSGGHPR